MLWRQDRHQACTNWVMGCWCGYLSGVRCRLLAYGPADATASQDPTISCVIWIQTGFTFLATGLTSLSWKRGRWTGVVVVVVVVVAVTGVDKGGRGPAPSGRAKKERKGYFYQMSNMYTCRAYLIEIRKFCSKNLVHKGVNFEAQNALKLTYELL